MYTQCPECQVAFRITAQVLQQARGQVRCGSCNNAFNALDHLYEEPPRPAAVPTESGGGAGEDTDERSKALLETLDRLAGPDEVRIEDTGVEWLVLDEDERSQTDDGDDKAATGSMRWLLDEPGDVGATETATATPADLDLDTAETTEQPVIDEEFALEVQDDEPRYDDNTPLPDDFEDDEDDLPAPVETPRRRTTDHYYFEHPHDDAQAELELSEPDDWMDVLDEVADEPAQDATAVAEANDAAGAAGGSEMPLEVEEELAAIHDELSALPDSIRTKATSEPPAAAGDNDDEARMEPTPDAGTSIEAVASELDELLESVDGEQSPSDEDATDTAPSPTERGEAAIADASAPTGDAVGDEVDEAERATADAGSGADDSDVAAGDAQGEADDEQIARAVAEALGGDGRDVLTDEPRAAASAIQYEESTGEFERAIAEAEDAILDEVAKADEEGDGEKDKDAAETDDKRAAERDEGDDDAFTDLAAMTAKMQIDEDLLLAMKDADLAASMTNEDGSPLVETIVMEGDVVRGALESSTVTGELEQPQPIANPESLVDTYMMSRRDKARGLFGGSKGLIAIVGVLILLLALQYVHTSRETLATNDLFNRTIGSVYRVLGRPVTPMWNVKGWQFETTTGSTGEDNELLTIYSRISNRSENPLPYPLVHVSLTDRYEEIIGSLVLEPDEYLAGNADPSRHVAAGDNFTAVITIAEPSPDATGFKLNVCYRVSSGRVRCAIEDFKAP